MNKQAIENRIAGAGMSQAEFTAKVRRIMQKLALRYGGKQTGSVATGYTADGVSWSASIYRQNASNGEVAGRLDVTANGRTISDFWNWDKVFEKAGIPVVNENAGLVSREQTIAGRIAAASVPLFDGKTPEEYAALWGGTSGQGAAHFYNYGSERQEKDARFFFQFMNGKGGIKDTLSMIEDSLAAQDGVYKQKDWDEMNRFMKFISDESRKEI